MTIELPTSGPSLSKLSLQQRRELLERAKANLARRVVLEEVAPIDHIPRSGRLPLSLAQWRLWFLEQLGEGGPAYHVQVAVRLRGELDSASLERALGRIVERHEALRTRFVQVDGEPVQVIDAPMGLALPVQDLSGQADVEAALHEAAMLETGRPFDLEHGPLVRACLLRLGACEHVLLVTMHHIVSDGWSIGVLVDEVRQLYTAYLRGEGDPLPAL
uniref:condensation domain-containing protein n=1 Tax=Pelomonas sp. BJYL3 TaxID=2976697 RepID=UPI0022B34C2A